MDILVRTTMTTITPTSTPTCTSSVPLADALMATRMIYLLEGRLWSVPQTPRYLHGTLIRSYDNDYYVNNLNRLASENSQTFRADYLDLLDNHKYCLTLLHHLQRPCRYFA